MTTAQTVYESALALIDEIEDDGSVSITDTASYAGKAPRLIDLLQRELALCEGVTLTATIDSLSDALEISDDTALRVMPYGLAAKFALSDKDADSYNEFSMKYEQLKRTIRVDEEAITDEYNILTGMTGANDW
jgi:hypothetical protein